MTAAVCSNVFYYCSGVFLDCMLTFVRIHFLLVAVFLQCILFCPDINRVIFAVNTRFVVWIIHKTLLRIKFVYV